MNQGIIPDPSAPGGFRIKPDNGSIAPWDDPETSHWFTTWPVVSFNEDGTSKVEAAGNVPYSFLDGKNYGPYSAAEDKRLDDAYNTWLHNPSRDRAVTRDQWFYGTKGGTADFNKTLVRVTPISREQFSFDFNNSPRKDVQSKIGDSAFIQDSIKMDAIQNLTNMAILPQDESFWSGVNTNNQGVIAINGTGYKVGSTPQVINTTYKGTANNPNAKQTVKTVEITDASGKNWSLILSGSLDGHGSGVIYRFDPATGGNEYKQA